MDQCVATHTPTDLPPKLQRVTSLGDQSQTELHQIESKKINAFLRCSLSPVYPTLG